MRCRPTSKGIVSDYVVHSEGYSEVCVSRVGRGFFGFDLSDVADQGLLNISYAILYISGRSLGEHLHCAVAEIADVAGQLMPGGHPVSGEPEAHALDRAAEDYVPCNHSRFTICDLPLTIGLRAITAIC